MCTLNLFVMSALSHLKFLRAISVSMAASFNATKVDMVFIDAGHSTRTASRYSGMGPKAGIIADTTITLNAGVMQPSTRLSAASIPQAPYGGSMWARH